MDSRSLFAAMDVNMDGRLSREEFREALTRLDLTQYLLQTINLLISL